MQNNQISFTEYVTRIMLESYMPQMSANSLLLDLVNIGQRVSVTVTAQGPLTSKAYAVHLINLLTAVWGQPLGLTVSHFDTNSLICLNSAHLLQQTIISVVDSMEFAMTESLLRQYLVNESRIWPYTPIDTQTVKLRIAVSGVPLKDQITQTRIFNYAMVRPSSAMSTISEAYQGYTTNRSGIVSVKVIIEYAINP